MKNYRMFLMGGKTVDMSAEQASGIVKAWMSEATKIIFDGSAYAAHQICSVERIRGSELKDMCLREGIEIKDAPRLEQFLSDKKLLT